MALINFPDGSWIEIPEKGYGVDYGKGKTVLERRISGARMKEIFREQDEAFSRGDPLGNDYVSYAPTDPELAALCARVEGW